MSVSTLPLAPTAIVGKPGWQTSEGQIIAALHVIAVAVGTVLGIVGTPHDAQVFGEVAAGALALADGLYAVSRSITKNGVVNALANVNYAAANSQVEQVVGAVDPALADRLTALEKSFSEGVLPALAGHGAQLDKIVADLSSTPAADSGLGARLSAIEHAIAPLAVLGSSVASPPPSPAV